MRAPQTARSSVSGRSARHSCRRRIMHTHIPLNRQRTVAESATDARLNWLLAANAREAERHKLFRHPHEEEEMLRMRRPVTLERAYTLFGMLLGMLPPAAFFIRIFG